MSSPSSVLGVGFFRYLFALEKVYLCRLDLHLRDIPLWLLCVASMQYLWHLRIKVRKHFHIFELFPILLTLAIIWLFSYILTVSGAYDNASPSGQQHCRTDRADAIASAPW